MYVCMYNIISTIQKKKSKISPEPYKHWTKIKILQKHFKNNTKTLQTYFKNSPKILLKQESTPKIPPKYPKNYPKALKKYCKNTQKYSKYSKNTPYFIKIFFHNI